MAEAPVTVGRIVHVQGGRGECQAAIVAYVHGPEMINVGLFTDQGIATPRTSVRQDERPAGERDVGTWHWPERGAAGDAECIAGPRAPGVSAVLEPLAVRLMALAGCGKLYTPETHRPLENDHIADLARRQQRKIGDAAYILVVRCFFPFGHGGSCSMQRRVKVRGRHLTSQERRRDG